MCEWRLAAAGPPARESDAYAHSDANGDTHAHPDGDADPDAIVMSRKRPGVQLALRERRLAAAGPPTGDVGSDSDPDTHRDPNAHTDTDGHSHTIQLPWQRTRVELAVCEWRLAAAGSPTGDVVADSDTHADIDTNSDADPDAIVVSRQCARRRVAVHQWGLDSSKSSTCRRRSTALGRHRGQLVCTPVAAGGRRARRAHASAGPELA
jgi:hypothetical protein